MTKKKCKHFCIKFLSIPVKAKPGKRSIGKWCLECGKNGVFVNEIKPRSSYPDPKELEGQFPWFHLSKEERKEKQKICEHVSWYECTEENDSDYWLSWVRYVSVEEWFKCFD